MYTHVHAKYPLGTDTAEERWGVGDKSMER